MIVPSNDLPVAVIGAGPVGLAAAAHLAERGSTSLSWRPVPASAAAIEEWRHVRLFSPWRYGIDSAARRLLAGRRLDRTRPGHAADRRRPDRRLPRATGQDSRSLRPDPLRRRGGRRDPGRLRPDPHRRPRRRSIPDPPGRRRRTHSPQPSSTPPAPGVARTSSADPASRPAESPKPPTRSRTRCPTYWAATAPGSQAAVLR